MRSQHLSCCAPCLSRLRATLAGVMHPGSCQLNRTCHQALLGCQMKDKGHAHQQRWEAAAMDWLSAARDSSSPEGMLTPKQGGKDGKCVLLGWPALLCSSGRSFSRGAPWCLHPSVPTCKYLQRSRAPGRTARGTLVKAETSYVLLLSFFLNKGKPNVSQGFLIIIIFIFIPAPPSHPIHCSSHWKPVMPLLADFSSVDGRKNFRYCPSYSDGCHRCLLPHLPQES